MNRSKMTVFHPMPSNTSTAKFPCSGVCLGHQALGAVFGGKVDRAQRLMHGKTSKVTHNGDGIFKGIPSPFEAMRYHSLVVYDPIPAELEVTAITPEEEIMGLKHREHQTYGVQFHPESILTEHGKQIPQKLFGFESRSRERRTSHAQTFYCQSHQPHRPH